MLPTPLLTPLTYSPDSAVWFASVRHLPHAIWLDSGRPGSHYGRFDIISAAPSTLLETRGDTTEISQINGLVTQVDTDPFQLLKSHLPLLETSNTQNYHQLPFMGGALGYFGYDLGRRLEKLPAKAIRDIDLPELCVGIYPWAIIQDHQLQQAWLVRNKGLCPAYNFLEIEQLCLDKRKNVMFHDLKSNLSTALKPFKIKQFESNLKVDDYYRAFNKIQDYLHAGDCYQVNLAQRFSADYSGDPFSAYLTLRSVLPSPFSGYMQLPHGAVLSLSPERFIQAHDNQVETKPIKGTIARGASTKEDAANAEWLKNSLKNRAENVMIVDLLRNDLSKHCTHVSVPKLCELQTFANVHHLVSTVTGELTSGTHCIDVLRDSFPGGSITGAPKIRAMEIIEELEPTRRSLYCGSLGYISVDGQMDTSIAIRTLVCDENKIYCWGGGGIVADSDAEQEYRESISKVAVLMEALEKNFQ